MRLPLTSAAQTFWIDAGRKGILFNTGAYATTATSSTLQVQSVLNRAGKQDAVVQATSANQPTWIGGGTTGLVGTYTPTNWPDTQGLSALQFTAAGSQYFEYDSLAGLYSNDAPVTVVAAVSAITNSGTAGTICAFGAAANYLTLRATNATTLIFSEKNATSTYSASATITSGSTHIVTGIRSGGFVTIRVDGVQVATTAIAVAGTDTYTNFAVGAQNLAGSLSLYLSGQIGELLVYSGNADIYSVEDFLMLKYGVAQGLSSTTVSGGF